MSIVLQLSMVVLLLALCQTGWTAPRSRVNEKTVESFEEKRSAKRSHLDMHEMDEEEELVEEMEEEAEKEAEQEAEEEAAEEEEEEFEEEEETGQTINSNGCEVKIPMPETCDDDISCPDSRYCRMQVGEEFCCYSMIDTNAGAQGAGTSCSETCELLSELELEEPTDEPTDMLPTTEEPEEPMYCTSLMNAPLNGNVEQVVVNVGKVEYRYSCDDGFHLEGLHFTVLCLDGYSTGSPPECVETGQIVNSGGCQVNISVSDMCDMDIGCPAGEYCRIKSGEERCCHSRVIAINAGSQGSSKRCSESCVLPPAPKKPMTEEPTTEKTMTEEPTTEGTMTEEPTTEETMTEEPTTEETMTEEPQEPQTCTSLMNAPANGNVERVVGEDGTVEYRYSCDYGFHLEGRHFTVVCIEGYPTGIPPVCVETGQTLKSGGCQVNISVSDVCDMDIGCPGGEYCRIKSGEERCCHSRVIAINAGSQGSSRRCSESCVLPPEEPMTEEPTGEEPLTEEPTGEEPLTEEPTGEEPLTEEPSPEEPMTEEPMTTAEGLEGCTDVMPQTVCKYLVQMSTTTGDKCSLGTMFYFLRTECRKSCGCPTLILT